MREVERVTDTSFPFEQTLNLKEVIGKRVISKNGLTVGRVLQVRVHDTSTNVEGIVVGRGILKQPLYIGKGYISRLSHDGILLTIDPSPMMRGMKVVTSEGEVIGKVTKVNRRGNTNDVDSLEVRAFLRGTFTVPLSVIKSGGQSILLKANYDVPKKHLFSKS